MLQVLRELVLIRDTNAYEQSETARTVEAV